MKPTLKTLLQTGQPLLGCWSVLGSPALCELFSLAGFDFLILDFEHGVLHSESLQSCLTACRSGGARALVRPPRLQSEVVQVCLDLGADGVIFPQVTDLASVQHAFAQTRFAPAGSRGYNPFTRASDFGLAPVLGRADDTLRCIIIENLSAWEHLDQLLQVDDLDLVYLGVYDMSVALGCPGEVRHPRVCEFVEAAIGKIHGAGKAVGLMVHNPQDIEFYRSLSVQVLIYGVDTYLVATLAQTCRAHFDAAGSIQP